MLRRESEPAVDALVKCFPSSHTSFIHQNWLKHTIINGWCFKGSLIKSRKAWKWKKDSKIWHAYTLKLVSFRPSLKSHWKEVIGINKIPQVIGGYCWSWQNASPWRKFKWTTSFLIISVQSQGWKQKFTRLNPTNGITFWRDGKNSFKSDLERIRKEAVTRERTKGIWWRQSLTLS